MITLREAKFLKSSTQVQQCPPPVHPEYAFAGRSNVGKSTLINMLTGRKGLAKTSATPGKTITINHYLIDNSWYLADLPGYGYAKISKAAREELHQMINDYLLNRPNLLNTFVLIDSRIPPQKIDIEFINSLGENSFPFTILFTKTEKLGSVALQRTIETFFDSLKDYWEELPRYIVTSGITRAGREDILSFINETNKIFKPIPKRNPGR
ncbi:MAG: GTP-binding protein [Bacteroidales bacterium]|jgi:GTP-binding protein|nr:GTP-binding protein [Bacteroidales bacterium]MDN5328959.1 GTP-binding protein [Bacteroidales bacterium]